MNKKLIILIILTSCIIGISGGLYYKNIAKKTTAQITAQINTPVTLDIPSIHVHAHIEEVGLDKNNLMGVPNNVNDVAWYKLGPEPGAIGNAVIDGHVDTQTGAPAVFAQLKLVKKGDIITIRETHAVTHSFRVTSVEELSIVNFPTNRIFGASANSHLNLITCAGTWDVKTANYSKRLVVFSELVK